jgi:diaminopimelate decarboxylase
MESVAVAAIKNRASAKEQVVNAWKERRSTKSLAKAPPKPAPVTTNNIFAQKLCGLVRQTWDHVTGEWENHQLQQHHKPHHHQAKGKTRQAFPSVLSILQANALKHQVEKWQDNDDDDGQERPPSSQEGVLLQVLPKEYDWNRSVREMATRRSRVFLLLDLTALIRRCVAWRKLQHNKVRFLHTVQTNANPKLLRVLTESGIGVAVTTRGDIEVALTTTTFDMIYDSTLTTGRPDAYVRDWVFNRNSNTNQVVVVDGPEEVHRIQASLERMGQRKRLEIPSVDFLLRLGDTCNDWRVAVEDTLAAIQEVGGTSKFAGLSLHCPSVNDMAQGQAQVQVLIDWITQAQPDHPIRIDLTGCCLSTATTDNSKDRPASEWADWWNSICTNPMVSRVTIEASQALVAPIGALCTRLIGVRTSNQPDQPEGQHRHYYIDDGCYGSLYSGGKDTNYNPLPLLPFKEQDPNSAEPAPPLPMYLTTVWGPTCDGLDKVCQDIPLPELQRDDWLVFPNLGCSSGTGTAFNGFAPPDTAFYVTFW